jgi:hypothetical protein
MCAVFTRFAFRTEASQVIWTKPVLLVVLQGAVGPEWAEAAVVVRTRRALRLGIDVQVEAVVAVGACEGASVIRAFRHPP